jgi:signal transduction histidine kinase
MIDRIAVLLAGLREVSDNIAHDLKTPLTRLRNRAEEALRSASTTEDYRAALEKTIDESDQLISIFNGLLMIARAEAGADRANMVEFDAAAAVRDVAELYEPLAEEEGASIELDAAPGLSIQGNRELVGQAVANLIDNALKYGVPDGGGGAVSLRVSARRVGNHVEIAVADHGPGIAAADRARVLDRFVRLEGSRSRPGSGLGLSLASAVARLHGGQLRLEDNEPGLRAILELPALPPREISPPLAPAQLPAPVGHADGPIANSPAGFSR